MYRFARKLSQQVDTIVPGMYSEVEDYALGISTNNDVDLRLELHGAHAGDEAHFSYFNRADLAKGLSDALDWTIITEPLPVAVRPDFDGDYTNPLPNMYICPEEGDTAESVRKAALTLLAIAQKMEEGESEAVNHLVFLLDEAGKGAKDNEDLARNLLKAGVTPPESR